MSAKILDFKFDVRAIRTFAAQFEKTMPEAAVIALGRCTERLGKDIEAEVLRIAQQTYTYAGKPVTIKVGGTGGKGETHVRAYGDKGVSLSHFFPSPAQLGGRMPPEGVSVSIYPGKRSIRKRKGYGKPFLMRKAQGTPGIFMRAVAKSRKGWSDFNMQWGPSPIQAVGWKKNRERIKTMTEKNFKTYIAEEIERMGDAISGGHIR